MTKEKQATFPWQSQRFVKREQASEKSNFVIATITTATTTTTRMATI
jgi:hypothetical protein